MRRALKCCLIALDVFCQFPYSKDRSEQTAWLSLLTTENLEDAEALIREYPWLEDAEIAMPRQRPEEVLGMSSEALQIWDQNTMQKASKCNIFTSSGLSSVYFSAL